MGDDFGGGKVLVSRADFGDGFRLRVGATGAAADVVAGEKSALRSGEGTEDLAHRCRGVEVEEAVGHGNGGGCGHGSTMDRSRQTRIGKLNFADSPRNWLMKHVPGPWSNPQVYLLPNLMTAGNLACGFSAVVTIFEGMRNPNGDTKDFYLAIFLILGACLFDALDGRLARLKGQESMFGREFDSLADIVSFGIAPALLVMDIVLSSFDNRLGWTIAFIYLLCGGMRLARFNCLAQMAAENPDKPVKREFVGFPIPAAAGLIASLTIFILWLNEGQKEIGPWRYVLLVLMLLLSFMMLSEFRYPSFKALNLRAKRSLVWLFAAALVLVCAVKFVEFVPLGIFLTYLIYGLVRPWVSREWREELEEGVEEGELELVEDDPAA